MLQLFLILEPRNYYKKVSSINLFFIRLRTLKPTRTRTLNRSPIWHVLKYISRFTFQTYHLFVPVKPTRRLHCTVIKLTGDKSAACRYVTQHSRYYKNYDMNVDS